MLSALNGLINFLNKKYLSIHLSIYTCQLQSVLFCLPQYRGYLGKSEQNRRAYLIKKQGFDMSTSTYLLVDTEHGTAPLFHSRFYL